jgi:PAS domain S-box-containing protein
VDDDLELLELLRRAVKSVVGFEEPYVASSYNDALLLVDACDFDLLVCDYNLGVGSGLDVIQRAKAKHSKLKTMLLTAYEETKVLASALKSGVDHYVHKPCDLVELKQCLRLLRNNLSAEIALGDALFQYSSLVHAIPDIVYKIDEKGMIVFVNQAVEMLGYQPNELLGEHIKVLIHPEDYKHCNSQDVLHHYKSIETGDLRAPKLIDERRSGDRMTRNLFIRILDKASRFSENKQSIEVSVIAYGEISSSGVNLKQNSPSLISGDHGAHVNGSSFFDGTVGIIRDISARRRYERELIENRLHLEEALRIKEEFLANMSHETRTPMNAILGMADALAQTDMNEEQRSTLESLMAGAEGLKSILDDVLALSQTQQGQLVLRSINFELSDVLTSLKDMFIKEAKIKGLDITFVVKDFDQKIRGDLSLVQQILSKLLSNAIKFTDLGSVEVELSIKKMEGDHFELCFSVSDTGIGISESQKEVIFGQFIQGDGSASRAYGGTGVGLALCRDLLDVLGGEIQLDSHLGVGATFHVRIPIDLAEGNDEMIEELTLPNINSEALVVSGNTLDSQRIERCLERYGMKLKVELDGESGLKSLMLGSFQGVFVSMDVAVHSDFLRRYLDLYPRGGALPLFVVEKERESFRKFMTENRNNESFDYFNHLPQAILHFSLRSLDVVPVLEEWKGELEKKSMGQKLEWLQEYGLAK